MRPRQPESRKPTAIPQIRCAIYTRKSSEEGLAQEFNSLDAQREAGEAYIASQKAVGWNCLPEHYDDGGYTGGNMQRPALNRLIADVEAGKIDKVVTYKIDRISRSLPDFMKMMTVFEEHGVGFVSVTQSFDTSTSMGRLTMHILMSFAEFEREVIGERIRDKIAASRQRGKWTGGTPILGYDVDRSSPSPKLVINSTEGTRVLQIFELYRQLGALLPVVAELEKRGWRNKAWTTRDDRKRGGLPFDKCRLHDLLTNIIYAGKVRHKDHVYDGEHEALVPADLFRSVQQQLQRNGRNGAIEGRNRHGSLLRGLLFCQVCNRAMSHTFTTRGKLRYRYYVCSKAVKSGRKACPTPSLPAIAIEDAVVDQIRCVGRDADVLKATLHQTSLQSETAISRLASERRMLDRGLIRLRGELVQAATGRESASLTAISEQIQITESRIAEIDATVAAHRRELVTEADVAAAFDDFDNVWKALTPHEQTQVVQLLVARVEFDAGECAIDVTFHSTGIRALADKARANAEEAA